MIFRTDDGVGSAALVFGLERGADVCGEGASVEPCSGAVRFSGVGELLHPVGGLGWGGVEPVYWTPGGPQMAPGLKKVLFGSEGRARFPTSGHALLSLLDAGSAGLGAALAALGTSSNLLRLAARERLRQAG